jgi:hypothetical protein
MTTTIHPSWKITDLSTGVRAIFFDDTPDAALNSMAQRAGHDDFAEMCAAEGRTVEAARANLRIEKDQHTEMTS